MGAHMGADTRPLGFFGKAGDYVKLRAGVGRRCAEAQVGIFEITPEEAGDCLTERNTDNFREPTACVLDALKGGLRAAEWIFNGNPLIFDRQGKLRDGQKRLRACKETGVPIVCLVVAGVDREADRTLDTNEVRTFRQHVRKRGEKSVNQLGGLVVWLLKMEKGHELHARKYTVTGLLRFYEAHVEALRKAVVTRSPHPAVSISLAAALRYQAQAHSYEREVDEFLELLRTGAGLLEGDPLLALRKAFEPVGRQKKNIGLVLNSVTKAAMFLKTWNLWVNGDMQSRIVWTAAGPKAEKFPKLDFPARSAEAVA